MSNTNENYEDKVAELVIPTTTTLTLRFLLSNLKKSIELWFLTNRNGRDFSEKNANSLEQIQMTCFEILKHGLHALDTTATTTATKAVNTFNASLSSTPSTSNTCIALTDKISLSKCIEDFEWLRRSAQIRDTLTDDSRAISATSALSISNNEYCTSQNFVKFLQTWILRNLQGNCLCACLQALVTEKEMLMSYYAETSFLRNEAYATALFICLSALELNQCSLLSQIDVELYNAAVQHRRSSSHPNFSLSISPPKRALALKREYTSTAQKHKIKPVTTAQRVFPTFRKIKSLPHLQSLPKQLLEMKSSLKTRPRSKTLHAAALVGVTPPKNIPKIALQQLQQHANSMTTPSSNTSSSLSADDLLLASTSTTSSKRSSVSNTNSHASDSTSPTSVSPTNSTTTARRIELINCDDIKVWTDQSCQRQQKVQPSLENTLAPEQTQTYAIPQQLITKKQAKSTSPINSLLCNLFGTPPTYTSWSLNNTCSAVAASHASDTTAVAAIYPCNDQNQLDISSGVFDAFLPVYGKKLRPRKRQNLFDEDGISSLDYTATDATVAAVATTTTAAVDADLSNKPSTSTCLNANAIETANQCNVSLPKIPKNCESLTAFLQMAQLSGNNTELEKENAHFRISEAIISAIEHMKWAKMEPDKCLRQNETAIATDWLESEQNAKAAINNRANTTRCSHDINEHIPYAEIGESCVELLSAEVVGLSLISKFNDKHLPKVSELKWLVSEEDTPQQLLPMPDNSPTANPDDNIIPSRTRGTKYWAPPRQQIIFTDHPPANRKLLIQKQNSRCAGCGMRVSPQYIHSFRYCTYLDKYLCTGCHRNQISPIPAKILHNWDFKCYPVSVFAYRLLEQMYTYPLFYVPDLNPALYMQAKALLVARQKRLQLKYVKDFIKTCRFAAGEHKYFDIIPEYITEDPDAWSMSDFIDTQNKSMQRSIDELIEKSENHIFNCVLCTARGFLCEHCNKHQIIYPWQQKTFRCDHCGACFHLNCWKSMQELCCRCQRINKRQDEITEI